MTPLLCFLVLAQLQHTLSDAVQSQSRIVNGVPIEASTYPWMASLRINYNDSWEGHNCGGSLIRLDPVVVMTATHCVDSFIDSADNSSLETVVWGNVTAPVQFWVDFNRTYAAQNVSGDAYQTLEVRHTSMIYVHDDFNISMGLSIGNDIALIIFGDNETLDFSNDDLPVLPSEQLDDDEACCSDGEKLNAIGYGRDSSYGNATETLEHTILQFINITQCVLSNWTFGEDELLEYDDNHIICVIGNDTDACYGDSGGPLFRELSDGTQLIVGVVSGGYGGCNSGDPTVYTSVGHFLYWMEDILGVSLVSASSSTTSYTTVDPQDGNAAVGMVSGNAIASALLIAALIQM